MAGKHPSLEDWLATVLGQGPLPPNFIWYQFPSYKHRQDYIATIHRRTEQDVRRLLKLLLIPSGCLGKDETTYESFDTIRRYDPRHYERMMQLTYFQRVKQ